jgi:hypothetical protein
MTESNRARVLADLIERFGRGAKHARGWKQELASIMGVSPGYISKFLKEPFPNLSEDTAREIEKRIGLPDGWMEIGFADDGTLFGGMELQTRLEVYAFEQIVALHLAALAAEGAAKRGQATQQATRELRHHLEHSAFVDAWKQLRSSNASLLEACGTVLAVTEPIINAMEPTRQRAEAHRRLQELIGLRTGLEGASPFLGDDDDDA